jgi:hypothetical protein
VPLDNKNGKKKKKKEKRDSALKEKVLLRGAPIVAS